MSLVPRSLLRRLYVRGSLANLDLDDDGNVDAFRFKLKNVLASGTLKASIRIEVDGERIPPEAVEVEHKGSKYRLNELTPERGIHVGLGDEIVFVVRKSGGLKPGEHTIRIEALTEYGPVSFDVKDAVS